MTPTEVRLRIAVIGCGGIANREHYPALASFPEVEIVGACDLDAERVAETCERWEIGGAFTDYRAMIEAEAPDAVYVILRPHHLFDPVAWCLEQGLDTFLEKPAGVCTYQTRALARIAERRGCLTMVGYNRRHSPLLKACRELVLARGPVIQCVSCGYIPHGARPAYYDGALDILHCHGTHYLDTLRWLAGEVTGIASQVRADREFATGWFALTRHEGGATGMAMLSWAVGGGRPYAYELHGQGISVFADLTGRHEVLIEGERDEAALAQFGPVTRDAPLMHYGFREENRYFIDCLLSRTQPSSCLSDAVRTMELADAVYGAADLTPSGR